MDVVLHAAYLSFVPCLLLPQRSLKRCLCIPPPHPRFRLFFISESKLVQAVGKYTAAIELNPTAIYLSNRAFCYVKLEQFGLAILDADLALT